jgi:hypothetical protein
MVGICSPLVKWENNRKKGRVTGKKGELTGKKGE